MRTATFLGSPVAMAAQHRPSPLPPHSAWRSPVPYLFGGLAAMLCLIAFALLLLACSYWKISGYLESEANAGDGADSEIGGSRGKPDDDGAAKASPHPPEQRIVVIMAGDEKPTFLATLSSSRASSFGDSASRSGKPGDVQESKMADDSRPGIATGSDGDSGTAEDGGRHHEEED